MSSYNHGMGHDTKSTNPTKSTDDTTHESGVGSVSSDATPSDTSKAENMWAYVAKVISGEARLTPEQAMQLYHRASLHDLGRWANAVTQRIHGDQIRTYVIDRNINYTNVCSADCTFCAFKRDLGAQDSYTLSTEQLHEKIQQLSDIGGTQILLQGGMHPELPITFYEDMLTGIKSKFPHIHVHGFSPPEFVEFVAVFDIEGFPTTQPGRGHEMPAEMWQEKLDVIMQRLMDAGLDSLPGGGGEIFIESVRRRIGIRKATADQWLAVMATAHRLGMSTSATMMFGHIEGVADRIDHMNRVREAQDLAIKNKWAGRYHSFIAWPFQRENTPLGRIKEWDGQGPFAGDTLADKIMAGEIDPHDKAACRRAVPEAGRSLRMAGATEYLRMQAISRLFLDNIHSIGSSWVTMGPKVGQLALFYGASDMGSVMMEENVVSAAGTTYCLDEAVLCHLIRDAGFTPAQRDNHYKLLHEYGNDNPDAPDRRVTDWSTHRVAKLHVESESASACDESGASDASNAVELTITAGDMSGG